MPIISHGDKKSIHGKFAVFLIYTILTIGGFTMIYPFIVTITGSMGTHFDYTRREPYPRFIFSREDRFMRTLCGYFPPNMRNSIPQLRSYFPSLPTEWRNWKQIGNSTDLSDRFAIKELACLDSSENVKHFENMARDYKEFIDSWNLEETVLAYDQRYVAIFLEDHYKTISAMNVAWQISVDDFSQVEPYYWGNAPFDQQGYLPYVDVRYQDLMDFTREYRSNRFTPYLNKYPYAVSYVRPAALAFAWEQYAGKALKINDYEKLHELPFPVPANASPKIRKVWLKYLLNRFPLRHVEIRVTQERKCEFEKFISQRFKNISYLNKLMKNAFPEFKEYKNWKDVPLSPTVPKGLFGEIWMDFVNTHIPPEELKIRNTLPEKAFQHFALRKYGNLHNINSAYGLKLLCIENLRIPFRGAFLATFKNLEWTYTLDQVTCNYSSVLYYLFKRGNAVFNTLILIILTLLITLTVNPLAGYALSRFRLRHTQKVLIFCLATMSFPASVTAIPGFLLLRDLTLLNTFAALVLPTAANGMSIFLLKGFFDSLPSELYEAATIDGANEMQIFFRVSLPLVKPILAVSMLNAFIAAYNGWAWAIIVCQDQKMWTIAVWTYQFSQSFKGQPFTIMAAYLISSLPVFLVFLFCQKIIMRGIILPQMK